MAEWKILLPGLFLIPDRCCNVYLVVHDNQCIAIDFGSGDWLDQLKQRNLPPLTRVYLTHHHVDQCQGLTRRRRWPFEIYAPAGDDAFLCPNQVKQFWKTRNDGPVPASYSVLPRGIPQVNACLAGFTDHFWKTQRVRFIATPGHGPNAISIILNHAGKQVVFCGDAAHAEATIHQPYHLEWDHWTATGIWAAIKGIACLSDIGMDLLLPSHGKPITQQPRRQLKQLLRKLHAFADTKGSICPGEKNHDLEPTFTSSGAAQLTQNLYQFGTNGYLLTDSKNHALLIDPWLGDIPALENLLKDLPRVRVTDTTATHYHSDHVDAAPLLKKRFGTKLWLHPHVAWPLAHRDDMDIPWRMKKKLLPDAKLPRQGPWRWGEFTFQVTAMPGQTWWHCGLMTTLQGKKILFGGDSFQPNYRWNGTGGFCSYNGCRFSEGFTRSAQQILDWKPDWILTGHGTYSHFAASQYRKILRWSQKTETVIQALCPSGNLEKDYFLHTTTYH